MDGLNPSQLYIGLVLALLPTFAVAQEAITPAPQGNDKDAAMMNAADNPHYAPQTGVPAG